MSFWGKIQSQITAHHCTKVDEEAEDRLRRQTQTTLTAPISKNKKSHMVFTLMTNRKLPEPNSFTVHSKGPM